MTTTGKTTTTLTAQETLDAWKDALRNSLALVEAYKPDEYDTKSERKGELPWGLIDLASRIGYELYMRRSWTLSYGPPWEVSFPTNQNGESLFGLIEQLIKDDDGFEQLVWDYGQAGGTQRLSRKADYSKPFGWNFEELNRPMASSDNKREQAWKDEQGIIDIDGEPTFYAF